ncbi:MAG: hypothetical protein H5T45_01570 [Thermoplasmatales archaeon]|nr:hypothetical protein [Thermoplasmatales archaeon]
MKSIKSLKEVKMKLKKLGKFIESLKRKLESSYFDLVMDILLLFHFYFLYYIFLLGCTNDYLILHFNEYKEAKIELSIITIFLFIFTGKFVKKAIKWAEKQS